MGSKSRNYGIDLLRVFSIFLVAILHVLGHGGVLASTPSRVFYSAAWTLEILAYPAVNCFVLISGFVGYRGEKYAPKLRNIISIFFTVLFYSAGIGVLFRLVDPTLITLTQVKDSFLPLIKEQYWFYSSYFGVFLLSPIINFFVYKASSKQLYLATLTVFLFGFITLESNAFILNYGYSVIWFTFVYMLGAIMKKLDVVSKLSGLTCALTFLVAFLCTAIPRVVFTFSKSVFLYDHAGYFVSYTSPTILLMAVALVSMFSKGRFNKFSAAVISFFSTSAFSVYLIHDNRHIRALFITDSFKFANNYNPVMLVLIVLGSAAAILIICTLIDKIRALLFRLLRIDKLSELIERLIKGAVNKSYNKMCK